VTRLVNVAANLEVTVVSGDTTVYKGYTDGTGRFETTPLEPGIYIFQLRIPRTMITPCRYTLVLGGARPLGDALVGAGVALGMNAQVRRPGPVRGQVTGRRVILVPPTTATAGTATATKTNGPAGTRTSVTLPRSQTNSTTTMSSIPLRATPVSAKARPVPAGTASPTPRPY
jgi:hypothetical protein